MGGRRGHHLPLPWHLPLPTQVYPPIYPQVDGPFFAVALSLSSWRWSPAFCGVEQSDFTVPSSPRFVPRSEEERGEEKQEVWKTCLESGSGYYIKNIIMIVGPALEKIPMETVRVRFIRVIRTIIQSHSCRSQPRR